MYRINASIRNAKGREIAHRTPLWSGPAGDPKHAIGMSHDALAPIVKAMAEADTIVLHVSGPKGLRLTTTEYAEDFRIGYGASAVGGTGLLADQIDTGLTPEQVAEATRALQARAIGVLPGCPKPFATGGLVPGTRMADVDGFANEPLPVGELDRIRDFANQAADTVKGFTQATGELDRIMRDFGTDLSAPNSTDRRYYGSPPYAKALDENARHHRNLGPGKMYLKQPDGSNKYIGDVSEFNCEYTDEAGNHLGEFKIHAPDRALAKIEALRCLQSVQEHLNIRLTEAK